MQREHLDQKQVELGVWGPDCERKMRRMMRRKMRRMMRRKMMMLRGQMRGGF